MKIENRKNVPTINTGIPTIASGKYFIKIFGCQYNEWDATRLDFMLRELGLLTANEDEAGIIFVLSCSVRQTAIDRLLGKVRNWQKAGKIVIITGCILKSDRKKYLKKNLLVWDIDKPEELKNILSKCHSGLAFDFTHALSVVERDPESYHRVSDRIPEFNSGQALKQAPQGGTLGGFQDDKINTDKYVKKSTAAYLPIMTGCNNFCAYCVVPYTRGQEASRPFDEIVKNFQELVKKGNKEILLLGQNVNSYRIQITGNSTQKEIKTSSVILNEVKNLKSYKSNFARLLKTLNNIPGDFTISFTSNHPKDMTDDIIEAVRDLPKVKKEIHLPLQSGSNKILKAMNRPYTKEKYLELAQKIKKMIPGISLSTDVIVGFPGETEEDFKETMDLLKEVNFQQVFVNKYSPRTGTAAFNFGDPIPWEEKERRWRILNEIANKNHYKH